MSQQPTRSPRVPKLLAVVAATWMALVAALLQATVFRFGSVDLDDLDYRNQAAAIRHGHVTLSAATHSRYFVPYLTGVHQGRIVFTHQPLWPTFIAVFEFAHMPFSVILACQAALCTFAAVVLIDELFDDRSVVAVAIAFVVLSPMVMVQSGTLLGYLPTLTLGLATTALALRSIRLHSTWSAAWAGLLGGLLIFNRPYDALLFLVPIGIYAVSVRRGVAMGHLARWACLGAFVPLVLILAYNLIVMGSVWRFPYTVHPQDTFGFGSRASFGPSGFRFGPSQAWSGLVHNTGQAIRWTAGGAVGIALAVVGLVAYRHDRKVWLLAAWVVIFPAAYFFFWTTWNIANFGLSGLLGPLYYLPSLVALAVLAGAGTVHLARWNRVLAVVAVAAALLLSVLTVRAAVSANLTVTNTRLAELAMVNSTSVTPRLVVTPPAFPDDPYVRFENPPDLGGPVLYGLSPGQTQTLRLVASQPDRPAFEVRSVKPLNGVFLPATTSLMAVSIERGRRLEFTLAFRPPAAESSFPVTAYAEVDGPRTARVQIPVTASDGRYAVSWLATLSSLSAGSAVLALPTAQSVLIHLGFREGGNGTVGHGNYEYRWAVFSTGTTQIAVLTPGESWRRYVFPLDKVAESNEDLSGILNSVVAPA